MQIAPKKHLGLCLWLCSELNTKLCEAVCNVSTNISALLSHDLAFILEVVSSHCLSSQKGNVLFN